MDRIHHVAVPVGDIAQAVDWYTRHFDCVVRYQDATWAELGFANLSLALVTPGQHPPHIGLARADARRFGELVVHRDGAASVYVRDPGGNTIEILDPSTLKESP